MDLSTTKPKILSILLSFKGKRNARKWVGLECIMLRGHKIEKEIVSPAKFSIYVCIYVYK